MDTMTSTKIIGAACGSLLGLLLIQWVAEEVYQTHHDSHQKVAYLLEIEEEAPSETEAVEEIPFLELLASADASKGKKVFGKCKACHKLGDGENGTGPHLFQIIGRQMAAVEGFKYSSSFNDLFASYAL